MDLGSVNRSNVEEFVRWVDESGGPGILNTAEMNAAFKFTLEFEVDLELHPLSEEYLNAQIQVYKELSGREIDQEVNEQTAFELEDHIHTSNAYGLRDPSEFVSHYQRLGKGVRTANLPIAAKVLDLGCGWGLSSEFLALLGCEVTAVDINPKFVELVQRRSKRLGYPIEAKVGTFESFQVEPQQYDAALFYECFHHSIAPWKVVEHLKKSLKDNGKIILAGEPIQNSYWPMWGLRLDPLSVYCINKFGWFESGWSLEFLQTMFEENGFSVEHFTDEQAAIGQTIIATLDARELAPGRIGDRRLTGWEKEGATLISSGESSIRQFRTLFSADAESVNLNIVNYGVKELPLTIRFSENLNKDYVLEPGSNAVKIELEKVGESTHFSCESWVPDEVLNNGDKRTIAFHLESFELV